MFSEVIVLGVGRVSSVGGPRESGTQNVREPTDPYRPCQKPMSPGEAPSQPEHHGMLRTRQDPPSAPRCRKVCGSQGLWLSQGCSGPWAWAPCLPTLWGQRTKPRLESPSVLSQARAPRPSKKNTHLQVTCCPVHLGHLFVSLVILHHCPPPPGSTVH